MVENIRPIRLLRSLTDEVALFSSAIGKDSIALTDMLYKSGFLITPVLMEIIENMDINTSYCEYAEKKYGIRYLRVKHYAVYSWEKNGLYGCKKIKQPNKSLSDIDDLVRESTGLRYSVYGFKKTDGFSRRIFLNELTPDYFHPKTGKCYPLAEFNNKHIYEYIRQNRLITPKSFSNKQSSDIEIGNPEFLLYMKKFYKKDLERIFDKFPLTEHILWNYENKTK